MKGDMPTTTGLGPREMLSLAVCLEEKKVHQKRTQLGAEWHCPHGGAPQWTQQTGTKLAGRGGSRETEAHGGRKNRGRVPGDEPHVTGALGTLLYLAGLQGAFFEA